MKLISAAIAILASVTVVSSIPLYNHSSAEYPSTTDGYLTPTFPTDNLSSHDGLEPTPAIWDSPPTETADASYCVGFKITSQTEADISWSEYSRQEVVFDFGTSKIYRVKYVDLVKFEDGSVVDDWATGPWYPENPRTGLHEIHLHHGDTGYYQFLVAASTKDHHHCKYFSSKFKVSRYDPSHTHASPVGQLQDTPTNTAIPVAHMEFPDGPSSSSSSSYSEDPTKTSSSYSADATATATISDTDGLEAFFDFILIRLHKIADDGDSSWKSHIEKIADDFKELKHHIQHGKTSGDDWINDLEKLEHHLDIIKTHDSGKWTDHIDALEHVLDKLKYGVWDDTYDDKVKAWKASYDSNNLTPEQELAGILGELDSNGTTTSTASSSPPVFYENSPTSPYEVPHDDPSETGHTEPTPSYYEP